MFRLEERAAEKKPSIREAIETHKEQDYTGEKRRSHRRAAPPC
jgi:hypothetical protein